MGFEAQSLGKVLFQLVSEIRLLSLEFHLSRKHPEIVDRINIEKQKMMNVRVANLLLSLLPRYMLEVVLISGLGLSVLFVQVFQKDNTVLSTVSLLVVAAYRILPSLATLILCVGSFRNSAASLVRMDTLGKRFHVRGRDFKYQSNSMGSKLIPFEGDLIFKDVSMQYPNSNTPVFTKFNFLIRKNTTLWVKGPNGSGKTTFIALATGLLAPTAGAVLIKRKELEVKLNASVSGISFLSQRVPLVDNSFAYNIVLRNFIEADRKDMIAAACEAGILDRILESPNGFMTRIGENGSLLSAGERQRLALARSLFSKPKLLVLDEPTSNLDFDAEGAIWNALQDLKGKMTIVIVSHREVPKNLYHDVLTLPSGLEKQ
jgi:ABC-type multidrug transport system fused ATPase/permease subunit